MDTFAWQTLCWRQNCTSVASHAGRQTLWLLDFTWACLLRTVESAVQQNSAFAQMPSSQIVVGHLLLLSKTWQGACRSLTKAFVGQNASHPLYQLGDNTSVKSNMWNSGFWFSSRKHCQPFWASWYLVQRLCSFRLKSSANFFNSSSACFSCCIWDHLRITFFFLFHIWLMLQALHLRIAADGSCFQNEFWEILQSGKLYMDSGCAVGKSQLWRSGGKKPVGRQNGFVVADSISCPINPRTIQTRTSWITHSLTHLLNHSLNDR